MMKMNWNGVADEPRQSSSVKDAGADPCRHLFTRTACLLQETAGDKVAIAAKEVIAKDELPGTFLSDPVSIA